MRFPSVRLAPRLKEVLCSPGLAVVAAFLLRMALLWLIHRGGDIDDPRFPTVGTEAENVARAIEATGRKKLIFAGISLEVCAAFPAMTAVARGLDAYVAVDASGGRQPMEPKGWEHFR